MTVLYDHALNARENHTAAARALVLKLKWNGHWVGGGLAAGYVFVDADGCAEGFQSDGAP